MPLGCLSTSPGIRVSGACVKRALTPAARAPPAASLSCPVLGPPKVLVVASGVPSTLNTEASSHPHLLCARGASEGSTSCPRALPVPARPRPRACHTPAVADGPPVPPSPREPLRRAPRAPARSPCRQSCCIFRCLPRGFWLNLRPGHSFPVTLAPRRPSWAGFCLCVASGKPSGTLSEASAVAPVLLPWAGCRPAETHVFCHVIGQSTYFISRLENSRMAFRSALACLRRLQTGPNGISSWSCLSGGCV